MTNGGSEVLHIKRVAINKIRGVMARPLDIISVCSVYVVPLLYQVQNGAHTTDLQ